jgi:hypothetical protein
MARTPKMTAEHWLHLFQQNLRPRFREAGYPLPGNVEIHCGYPKSKRALGEFHRNAAAMKRRPLARLTATPAPTPEAPPAAHHLFILPDLDDSRDVAAVLVHELIHAAMPASVNHQRPYQDACRALGLVMIDQKGATMIDDQPDKYVWFNHPRRGAYTHPDNDPPRLSPNGLRLREFLNSVIKRLGPYPHKAIHSRVIASGGAGMGASDSKAKFIRFKCPECRWRVRIGPLSLSLGMPRCGNEDCENFGEPCEQG